MNDCLSEQEIELLNSRRTRGKGMFAALRHLEDCEKCRAQIKLPTEEEIFNRFRQDEVSPAASASGSASHHK